jgi:hypothetical protein
MNYGEGYTLFLGDETVRFRISAKPYNHVKGEFRGTKDQFDLLTQAMTGTLALAALTGHGIEDSVVIDYPEIKEERHQYFTMRKRMQEAGQTAFNDVFRDKEQRFVHDQLHTVSRCVASPTLALSDCVLPAASTGKSLQ